MLGYGVPKAFQKSFLPKRATSIVAGVSFGMRCVACTRVLGIRTNTAPPHGISSVSSSLKAAHIAWHRTENNRTAP